MNKFQALRQFLTEKAPTCVHPPKGMLPCHFVTPTYGIDPGADDRADLAERSRLGHYLQMYDWDACFFAQMAPRLGMPELAGEILQNFLSLMRADGYIPRTISPDKIWDGDDAAKPFLATLAKQAAGANKAFSQEDNTYLKGIVEKLAQYLRYWQGRQVGDSGLYHWRNVLESGVDDNLALIAPTEASKDENEDVGIFPDGRLIACDLSAYLAQEYDSMVCLEQMLGNEERAQFYREKAESVKSKIDSLLFCAELGLHLNYDPKTKSHIHIRSWTSLVPALLALAPSPHVEEIIERNILEQKQFLRPCGLSSMAQSEVLYNQLSRGLYGRVLVSNWQGPMWTLPNVLAVRALNRHGFKKQGQDLAARVLNTLQSELSNSGTLYENYNAETGAPLWAPQFISWNVLCLELIDLFD